MSQENSAIITAFVREFDVPAPDGAKLGAYFTEDAVYHNIPMQPMTGRAAIQAFLGGMTGDMKSAGWEVLHQVAQGNVVMNERIDRFINNGKSIAIRVTGVFELRGGKISAWRDYFDLAEFTNQMQA